MFNLINIYAFLWKVDTFSIFSSNSANGSIILPFSSSTKYWLYDGVLVQPTVEWTFNKEIVDSIVENNDEAIINMAKALNAEVFGEEYSQTSSYRGTEPWASIDDAVELAKKEIADGKVKRNVIELMISNALAKSQKARQKW